MKTVQKFLSNEVLTKFILNEKINEAALFMGIGKDETIHLIKNEEMVVGVGELHERLRTIKKCGNLLCLQKRIFKTPMYQPNSSVDTRIVCTSPTTKKQYLFVGRLVSKAQSAPIKKGVAKKRGRTEQKWDATKHKKSSAVDVYTRQFEFIAAQRAAGLDPDVRMSFITMFVDESRPNLYRKMGTTFPSPIKRGKGSFWPMSLIEAYKAGTYQGAK